MAGVNSVCFVSFIFVVSCFLRLSASAKVEWKINLGGEPTNGFQAEEAVLNVDENLAKMRYHGQIKGSGSDLNVFKTQRFSRAEDLVLNFPVPDGVYTVTLMFAETWKGAYGSGNRVFDVYLGSKPGGIVKVIDQMDPFRSGGPAGPVRRKFGGIATQGGLTLALRPIKQNPQIAGIIIEGYSYGNAFMEDLPTVPAGPFEGGDFGSLDNIGPRPPADSSLLYDPSLNPKFKASNRPQTPGSSPSQASTATVQGANPSTASGTPGQPALPNPFGTSQNTQSVQSTQGTNAGSIATPGLSSPFSNTAYGAVGATGAGAPNVPGSSQAQTVGRPAPVAVGSAPFGAPQGAMQYRSFRRRLASYYGEGTPMNFPFAPNGDIGDSGAVPEQTARNQGYPDNMERVSPMLSQGNHPVAVNDISSTPVTSQQDTVSQSPGSGDGGQGDVGELSPSGIGDAVPLNRLEDESSRTQLSEMSREQEQASPHKETLPQNPMLPQPDLQSPVKIRDVQEDTLTPFKGEESLPSEMAPKTSEESIRNFQERSLPERGNDIAAPSIPRGLDAQVRGGPEFRSTMPELQTSSSLEGQGGLRDEAFSSDERGNLGGNRSPTDFMNGIRNQLQSLIRKSKDSDRTPEEFNDHGYSATRHEAASTSPIHDSQERKRTFRPFERASGRLGVSRSLAKSHALDQNVRGRGTENHLPSNSFDGRFSRPNALQGSRLAQRRYADAFEQRSDNSKFSDADSREGYVTKLASGGTIDEPSSRYLRAPRSLNSISTRQTEEDVPGLPGVTGSSSGSEDPSSVPEVPPSAGVHIGNGRLDGICIDNSTHCSCGMVNEEPKECLYVAKEDGESLMCVRRPCNGRLICACAPGASSLCERSMVRDILVPATVHKHGDTEESEVIPCRRENLEHGINVLIPAA